MDAGRCSELATCDTELHCFFALFNLQAWLTLLSHSKKTMKHFAGLAIVILLYQAYITLACPWDVAGLTSFQSLPNANLLNGAVVVDKPTLINSSTPLLRSIIVRSGGSLVFDAKPMNITVNFIRVESGGSFILVSVKSQHF